MKGSVQSYHTVKTQWQHCFWFFFNSDNRDNWRGVQETWNVNRTPTGNRWPGIDWRHWTACNCHLVVKHCLKFIFKCVNCGKFVNGAKQKSTLVKHYQEIDGGILIGDKDLHPSAPNDQNRFHSFFKHKNHPSLLKVEATGWNVNETL